MCQNRFQKKKKKFNLVKGFLKTNKCLRELIDDEFLIFTILIEVLNQILKTKIQFNF